ncbi:unnamed protein product [Microthlaspi erraticum]|uniref:Uncharacterized protein n=1 Tax=Microthlaspi erraticum TaxID=1685480 RepID=A0A6D2KCI7_9BRAS|nr:unnamed protein product [Microthlaspi erraticum]CAA7054724.1 unnamed protein product [Microthlaspi erraticum]
MGYGVFLCRRMSSSSPSSSKAEESFRKIDAFGNVAEELVPEKSVEAMATKVSVIDECTTTAIENFSSPEGYVYYVINGIHELTGFNWWMSIVVTAFLVNGLMSPLTLLIQRQAWELQIYGKSIKEVMRVIQTCDPKALPKYKKWEADWMEKFAERCLSFLPLVFLHTFITISFCNGISAMAKKIPHLSIPDSLYVLLLVTSLTFWLTSQIPPTNRTNVLSRMKKLPLVLILCIAFQAVYQFEPAVYIYMIPSRIYIYALFLMMRPRQIIKLRRGLGWPVTASEQERIMARVMSLLRELTDVLKKKDKN